MTTELPRYTSWGQVPPGLHTKTQWLNMDPPRKLRKGAAPVARVLYHGNKYAPLYVLDATEIKPPPTEAQLAGIRRAAAARHICKRCDARTHPTVTPDTPPAGELDVDPFTGRLCERCHHVLRHLHAHRERRRWAGRILDEVIERGAVVIHPDDWYAPRALALVAADSGRIIGQDILYCRLAFPGQEPAPGELSYLEAITRIDRLMRELPGYPAVPLFLGWRQNPLAPLVRLVNHDVHPAEYQARYDADREANLPAAERWHEWTAAEPYEWMQQKWHPWQDVVGRSGDPQKYTTGVLRDDCVQTYWAPYYAEPSHGADDPRYFHCAYPDTVPGASGDLVADAQLVLVTLARVADGPALVSPRAPWMVWPPQPGFVDGAQLEDS